MNAVKNNPVVVLVAMLGLALALTLATPAPAEATHSNNGGGVGTPEFDPEAMAGALTLLAGGTAIATERRRSGDSANEI